MATKKNLVAEIGFRNIRNKFGTDKTHYLAPNTVGGDRPQKANEKMLAMQGIIGNTDEIVPTIYATNNNGKVPYSLYERALSGLHAIQERGFLANKSALGKVNANNDFFAGKAKGHSIWAIWQRRGDAQP